MRLSGAIATTACVKARRRSAPAGCPTAPQLFLKLDDGFRAFQALCQTGIIALSQSQFGCKRVGFSNLPAALGGRQCTEGSGVPLLAPFGEGRRVNALATQDGTDAAGRCRAIGLGQDAYLVPRGERTAPRRRSVAGAWACAW
jgi:hypothetical protein